MATWPASVPFVIAAPNIIAGPINAVVRTQMDVGPAKARRRATAATYAFSGSTPPLTAAQRDAFLLFHDVDLALGTLSFSATDPVTLATKTYRIIGPYELTRVGGSYRVSLDLEILP